MRWPWGGPTGESKWTIMRSNGSQTTINFERSMSVANGVFNNQVACLDASGNHVPIGPKFTFDEFKDGQSNTMLFSESVQAMPWHRIGFATREDLVVESPTDLIRYPEAARYVQGMVWHYESDSQIDGSGTIKPVHRISGSLDNTAAGEVFVLRMNPINASDLARPSSAHVGSVNASYADGSTHFIADSIDYRVYQALLTPDDGNSDLPEQNFVVPGDQPRP